MCWCNQSLAVTPSLLLLLLSKTSKCFNKYNNALRFAKVCVKWVPQYRAKHNNSVHGNMHIMMCKKNSCPGLSRGGKMWRHRQSAEWSHYTFHRINTGSVDKITVTVTVTTFSVSRLHFSGCDAYRTGNKHIYNTLTKLPEFSASSSSKTCRSPGIHLTKQIPQINMKFMEVIM